MALEEEEMLFSGRVTRPVVHAGAAHLSVLVLRRRRAAGRGPGGRFQNTRLNQSDRLC